ncbi:MAG: hypothetical protein FWG03_04740 [Clostridiales bacterium]|nr:hypothetical protein [Clostridiales bacterium]
MRKIFLALVLAFVLAAALAACGGGNEGGAPEADEGAGAPAEEPAAAPSDEATGDGPAPAAEGEGGFVDEPGRLEGISTSVMAGSFSVASEWVPFQKAQKLTDWNGSSSAATGDMYYVVASTFMLENGEKVEDSLVKQYKLVDGMLVDDGVLPAEGYSCLCTDDGGVLYVSGFRGDFLGFKDGSQAFAYDRVSTTTCMDPSGKWGLSWHSGPSAVKFTIEGGVLEVEEEEWEFPEVSGVGSINISQDHIFVSGSNADEELGGNIVLVYDKGGNLETTLGLVEFGEPGRIAWVNAVVETKNGFMVLDCNFRQVSFFAPDGTFISTIKATELFGFGAWLTTAQLMPDGSILVGMTEEREDESCNEYLVYRLTGF